MQELSPRQALGRVLRQMKGARAKALRRGDQRASEDYARAIQELEPQAKAMARAEAQEGREK